MILEYRLEKIIFWSE